MTFTEGDIIHNLTSGGASIDLSDYYQVLSINIEGQAVNADDGSYMSISMDWSEGLSLEDEQVLRIPLMAGYLIEFDFSCSLDSNWFLYRVIQSTDEAKYTISWLKIASIGFYNEDSSARYTFTGDRDSSIEIITLKDYYYTEEWSDVAVTTTVAANKSYSYALSAEDMVFNLVSVNVGAGEDSAKPYFERFVDVPLAPGFLINIGGICEIRTDSLVSGNAHIIIKSLSGTLLVDIYQVSSNVAARAIDKFQTSYMPLKDLVKSPVSGEDAYTITSIESCFEECENMTTAPSIPIAVSNYINAFMGCYALQSDIIVYGYPLLDDEYQYDPYYTMNMFLGTDYTKNNYIVDRSTYNDWATNPWRQVASEWPNLHYENEDDVTTPVISGFNGMRVKTKGSKQYDEIGEWVYVKANIDYQKGYIPYSWIRKISDMSSSFNVFLVDGVTQTMQDVSPTVVASFPSDIEFWCEAGNVASHLLSLTIAASTYKVDEEGREIQVDFKDSNTALFNIPKAFAVIDYFHDDLGEGIAIGKFAEASNLFDIEMAMKQKGTITIVLDAANPTDAKLSKFLESRGLLHDD